MQVIPRPESPVCMGRSLRSLGFSCLSPSCGAVLDSTPEGHRRVPGVSGRPEFPALGDRSLRPLCASSTKSPLVCGVSGRTGVSGPPDRSLRSSSSVQSVVRCWCPVRRDPGRSPESPAHTGVSGPLTPESPVQVVSNGQIFQRGINTPPTTSRQLSSSSTL